MNSIVLALLANVLTTSWMGLGISKAPVEPEVRMVSGHTGETVVEITLQGFQIDELKVEGATFHRLSFPRCFFDGEIGAPELPTLSFTLGIPEDAPVSVEILETDETPFTDVHVFPRQEPRRDMPEEYAFRFDPSFYGPGLEYPLEALRISEPAVWRDVNVVSVTVCPFRYIPETRELTVAKRMTVRVTHPGFHRVPTGVSPV